MKLDKNLGLFGLFATLLALAPFRPEPHLYGKINWVLGGAVGMEFKDWFDLAMHGLPISIFLFVLSFRLFNRKKN